MRKLKVVVVILLALTLFRATEALAGEVLVDVEAHAARLFMS